MHPIYIQRVHLLKAPMHKNMHKHMDYVWEGGLKLDSFDSFVLMN